MFNSSHSESLTFYFSIMSLGNTIISVIYRIPDNSFENSTELFNEEFNKYLTDIFKSLNNSIICAGDFNIDLLKYAEHTPTTEFINLLFSCNLFPLISKPTRITNTSATLIDNIYVASNLTVTHADILYADISDHFPIYAIFPLSINTPREQKILYRDMSLKNRNSLCNALLITDWQLNDTDSNISVNNMYSSFANKYLNLINMYCPLKSKVVSNKTDKPWITKNLINCCRKKQQLYKKSLRNPAFKLEHINYRNTVNNTIRKAKSYFYHKQINENKNNLKRMWSTINSIINKSKPKSNGETFNIDINYANNYFSNVAYETVKKIPNVKSNVKSYLDKRQIQSIFLNPVSENDIVNIINQLPVTLVR